MIQFGIIVEKGQHNYSAFVPDLPDGSAIVATGYSLEDVQREMLEAIRFYLEDHPDAGEPSIYIKALREYGGEHCDLTREFA